MKQGEATSTSQSHDAVLVRLESVLMEENAALRRHDFDGIRAHTERKAQCLVELTRAVRATTPGQTRDSLSAKLQVLRSSLQVNKQLLALHLRAVADVSEVLLQTLNCADSDGTYSPGLSRGSARA